LLLLNCLSIFFDIDVTTVIVYLCILSSIARKNGVYCKIEEYQRILKGNLIITIVKLKSENNIKVLNIIYTLKLYYVYNNFLSSIKK
jgi:hypothetical protein